MDQLNAKMQHWDYNQGLVVFSDGLCGGLALLWKHDTMVPVQNISHWFIDADVFCATTELCWRLTGFYGHLETNKHEKTWNILESLSRSSHLPWLFVRDFNEISSHSIESWRLPTLTRQMDRFRRTIHLCNFIDLGYIGSLFTWSRNHPTKGCTHIRLDRALANNA